MSRVCLASHTRASRALAAFSLVADVAASVSQSADTPAFADSFDEGEEEDDYLGGNDEGKKMTPADYTKMLQQILADMKPYSKASETEKMAAALNAAASLSVMKKAAERLGDVSGIMPNMNDVETKAQALIRTKPVDQITKEDIADITKTFKAALCGSMPEKPVQSMDELVEMVKSSRAINQVNAVEGNIQKTLNALNDALIAIKDDQILANTIKMIKSYSSSPALEDLSVEHIRSLDKPHPLANLFQFGANEGDDDAAAEEDAQAPAGPSADE